MPIVPKGPYLDFELPVAELAQQIEDLMKNTNISSSDVKELVIKKEKLQKKIQKKLTPWNRVELARRAGRPYTLDFVESLFTDFIELHGDRHFGEDAAIVCGFARFQGQSVAIVGHQKGKDTKESIRRNFGSAHPEGYRKALRIFKMAEKFKIPLICFVDTAGAYPGIGAEERGQAQAIAENIKCMTTLEVPIIVIVIGEGGSGGALGIGVGDRILMLENAWYSVITPEGCAAILWKESSKKKEVSAALKLTAEDLLKLGIIDRIIPEPLGGAHWCPEDVFFTLKKALSEEFDALKNIETTELIGKRISKYAEIGVYSK